LPNLDWERFKALPGAPDDNWERLCRAIVFRNFQAFGRLRAVAQQPGIEFHLSVERYSAVLGAPGRWWGWQCKWYERQPGQQLTATQRNAISDAVQKTEAHVPGVTDWVLWLRRPLTPADQRWFFAIATTMKLHAWTEDDVDALLAGEAEVLRATFFGDLVLTPEALRRLRDGALAPIKDRWIPELHVEVDVEQELRKVLGERSYWPELDARRASLDASISELRELEAGLPDALRPDVSSLLEDLRGLCRTFDDIADALDGPRISDAKALTEAGWTPNVSATQGRSLARRLRRARNPGSIAIQAALAQHRASAKLFVRISEYLSFDFVAVTASAGHGKTYLAAELTNHRGQRPHGIYLPAWPLERRGTLNDLLPHLRGLQVSSIDQLLEAVEAAGIRAGARIPIVIDGLTESEDPVTWRDELTTLRASLARFEHIVVIVTLRPSGEDYALPEGSPKITLRGFDRLTKEAVTRYFAYYKINTGDRWPLLDRFNDPLFLRIFCEATNPSREEPVGPEAVPTSLVAAFFRYREVVVERIANRRGAAIRRYPQDVLKALDTIALSLWDTNRRAMPSDELRELINDANTSWPQSLAHALEDEGVLTRDPDPNGTQRTAILFDAFAGFLIGDSLTRYRNQNDFAAWIAEPAVAARLTVPTRPRIAGRTRIQRAILRRTPAWLRPWLRLPRRTPANLPSASLDETHPLAADIRKALVGVLPRAFRIHLWPLLEGDLRMDALVDATELEGMHLDAATVEEIQRVALLWPRTPRVPDLFARLQVTRDAPQHPLNVVLVDRLLAAQAVADRDLRWSEWVRRTRDQHLEDLQQLTATWQARSDRGAEDRLRAIWVKWLLTSTDRQLRDHATGALYWFGRGDPSALFDLIRDSLETNDPYVPERLLAAAFGVMMAAPGESREFGDELSEFLDGLWAAYCGETAVSPTEHWLIREYVRGIVEVAQRYYQQPASKWVHGEDFASPHRPQPIPASDGRGGEHDRLIYGFDFRNYTIGRIVEGRGNYEDGHAGYQEVLSWIRARVWELGWRSERFAQTEKAIVESRPHRGDRPDRTDQYRKKYNWVGFFESAGRLEGLGRLPLDRDEGRLSDVDIDPSFPVPPSAAEISLSTMLPLEPDDREDWIRTANVDVPDELLRADVLRDSAGPWLAVDGYVEQENLTARRRVFGFIRALLVKKDESGALSQALADRPYPGNSWLPEMPSSYYLFAGELPWSTRARHGLAPEELADLYRETIAVEDGREFVVEVLAHHYAWESSHSTVNDAGGNAVPAITLADAFDLRAVPASLDWCDPDGQQVSMTLGAPGRFDWGRVLYIREDLVREYCERHDYDLIWMVWGEREIHFADSWSRPDWVQQAWASHANIWRRVASLADPTPPAGSD